MLVTECIDDRCAGPGGIGQPATAGDFRQRIQNFSRETIGIGGHGLRGNDTGNFPVADGGILTHGCFLKSCHRTGGRVHFRQAGHTISVAEARCDHVGDMQLRRSCAGGEGIAAYVTKLIGIRLRTDAKRVEYK